MRARTQVKKGFAALNVLVLLGCSRDMPRSVGAVKVEPESFDRIAEQAMGTVWMPHNPGGNLRVRLEFPGFCGHDNTNRTVHMERQCPIERVLGRFVRSMSSSRQTSTVIASTRCAEYLKWPAVATTHGCRHLSLIERKRMLGSCG
jgi:hypothetical protein